MEREEFETAFSEFIDAEDYRQAENVLLSLARAAFAAGWCAARYPANPTNKTNPPR